MYSKKRKIIIYGVMLSLLSTTFFSAVNYEAKAAVDSTLYFNLSSSSVTSGQSFTADAMINPGTNQVSAAELHITYDQTKLNLTSVACSSTFSTALYTPAIPNPQDGTASIYCGVPLGSDAVTAATAIATFSFTSIGAGTNSPIAFANTSVATADNEPGLTNVVLTRTSSSVTINAAASSSSSSSSHKKKKKKKKKKKTSARSISVSKTSVKRGSVMTFRGKKFSKNSIVFVYFSRPGGGYYGPTRIKTNASGGFTISNVITKPVGSYSFYVLDTVTKKVSKTKIYKVK